MYHGIFDFFKPVATVSATSASYTESQKIAAGTKGLTFFHNESLDYSNYPFKTVDQLVDYVNKLSPGFLKNYGNAILITNFKEDDLKSLNEDIAGVSKGKLPITSLDLQIFWDALQEEFSSTSAKISQFWQGVSDTSIQAMETLPGLFGLFVKYKLVALGIAGVAAVGAIYAAYSKKKVAEYKHAAKKSNPKRRKHK